MVVPLLIYIRRPEIAPALRASCCWLLLPHKGLPAVLFVALSRAGSLRVYALLLADHRLFLLGSPWFDPDAKPRGLEKASVSQPLAPPSAVAQKSSIHSV